MEIGGIVSYGARGEQCVYDGSLYNCGLDVAVRVQ